jgi:hypothetical protein
LYPARQLAECDPPVEMREAKRDALVQDRTGDLRTMKLTARPKADSIVMRQTYASMVT